MHNVQLYKTITQLLATFQSAYNYLYTVRLESVNLDCFS